MFWTGTGTHEAFKYRVILLERDCTIVRIAPSRTTKNSLTITALLTMQTISLCVPSNKIELIFSMETTISDTTVGLDSNVRLSFAVDMACRSHKLLSLFSRLQYSFFSFKSHHRELHGMDDNVDGSYQPHGTLNRCMPCRE